MKNTQGVRVLILVALAHLVQPSAHAGQMDESKTDGQTADASYGEQLGNVNLEVSCSEAADPHLSRGLALLHHMTYEGARQAFARAVEADADCALGYWGQAMTLIHPLWSDPPSMAEFKQGQSWLDQAGAAKANDHARAYLEAVAAYYREGKQASEQPNLAAFERGWAQVHRRFPDDLEAASFYALAQLGTVDPADKDYSKQKRAGALAKQVLEANPDHPGAHHYLIHAFDYPPLSDRALEVARDYGDIAPAVPHALHMPTHIFTRLGKWQDSIALNRRSAAAALKHPAGDAISLHYPHALDYLAYAHLQRGEDAAANQVLATLRGAERPYQVHVATAYALAAVPARLALERHAWGQAKGLKARRPADFPWDKFPAMEAISHFAVALGAARSGDVPAADAALERLATLQRQAAQSSGYWAKQVEIQRLAAQAWLEYERGRQAAALQTMHQAAELEAATEKHPVTPGEILPARELLADMLLDMGRYEQASAEYERALARSAHRFNSLYGAGRAAELAGDHEKANRYYQKLDQITAEEAPRDRLIQARGFLAGN